MTLEELLPTLSPESRVALFNILVVLNVRGGLGSHPEVWDLLLAYRHVDGDTLHAMLTEVEKQYCLGCGDEAHGGDDHDDSDDDDPGDLELTDELTRSTIVMLDGLRPQDRLYVLDNLLPLTKTEVENDEARTLFDVVENLLRLSADDCEKLAGQLDQHFLSCCGRKRAEGCACEVDDRSGPA